MLVVALIMVMGLVAIPAAAQPLFGDPLADSAVYRSMRGELPSARHRIRYELTSSRSGESKVRSEIVLDVADDWSLTRDGERAVLRDFRLNRTFELDQDGFTTSNGLGPLVFRVMERQNRAFLRDLIGKTGGQVPGFDACSFDAELGVRIPGSETTAETRFVEQGDFVSLECNGRKIGGFEPGDGPETPPAFWPTAFEVLTVHPELHRRMREHGRVPARLETVVGADSSNRQKRSWKLVSIELVTSDYPLRVGMVNRTGARFDSIVGPGTARLVEATLAGRAAGGVPTRAGWGRHLESLSRREGPAAAAMELMPSMNMFPRLERDCAQGDPHPVCALIRDLPETAKADPAVRAIIEVADAEQRGADGEVIEAMTRARKSPLRDHPALGASFALALAGFDDEAVDRARRAGLPVEVPALQARAVAAYPYNPAYWTDIGDRFGAEYEWVDALLLFDVAFSLPMPEALGENRALQAKRESIERIRRDLPNAFLPR